MSTAHDAKVVLLRYGVRSASGWVYWDDHGGGKKGTTTSNSSRLLCYKEFRDGPRLHQHAQIH